MNDRNLPDELLVGLQLQKKYIGLQVEEKAARILAATSLSLAFLITGTVVLFYWGGVLASLCFGVVCLLALAYMAHRRECAIARTKRKMEVEIKASNALLKTHFSELASPPHTLLSLYQTIRTLIHIIREVKTLLKL